MSLALPGFLVFSQDAIKKLLEDAQGGRIDAFDRLFNRLSDRLYRFFFLRLQDQTEARDLLHDLFLELWRSLPRYRARADIPFTAWIYKIARRMLADFWRTKQRRKIISLDALIAAGREPQAIGSPGDSRLEVREILDLITKLPLKEHEIVTLRYLEGMSHTEIASILNLKPAHVRQLAHRALKKLRSWLENPPG